MRDNRNPHLARLDKEPEPKFHSGFQIGGRPQFLILPPLPHLPAPYDRADVEAWKSLNIGKAGMHQQLRCIEHLAILSNFNGDPYVPGDPVATAYASGKRRIFQQILDMVRFVEATKRDGTGAEPKEQG